MTQNGGLRANDGYLLVDCSGADARSVSEIYRAFAVECIEKQTRRALILAERCDADGHGALRDAFTVMILADMAVDFRVALVADQPALRMLFDHLQHDLQRLNVCAEVFATAGEGVAWLLQKAPPRPRATQPAAQQHA